MRYSVMSVYRYSFISIIYVHVMMDDANDRAKNILFCILISDCNFVYPQDYESYYDRRGFEDTRDLYERRFTGMTGPCDMGSSMYGLDFPPMSMPPLPPRRDPMPPMPPLGMGSMRDTGFSRGNEYGMFSRRSPPPSGNNGRFR
jgi:hypothetical protein